MLKKIKKDYFYKEYYKKNKSIDLAVKAGFFDDKINFIDYRLDFLCTPINKLKIDKKKENYVLITTGAFSPIHDGHINNLLLAKKELEKLGHHVAGAYISPSHDNYVNSKQNGNAKCHILDRISKINHMIKDNDFIMNDPFEGVFTENSINFTDVILRIEKYLKMHICENIKVIYVYGSDNYDFGHIFHDRFSVCIERKNHEKYVIHPNIIYIRDFNFKDISSTKIRLNHTEKKQRIKKKIYLIRDDTSMQKNNKKYDFFKQEFLKILSECIPDNIEIKYIDIPTQLKKVKKSKHKTISLDKYYKGDINLNLSRIFELSGSQFKNADFLLKNHKKIDNKEKYRIIDDDIITGRSIKYIKDKLSLKISNKLGLNSYYYDNNLYDIIDLRDFIFNFKNGGLLVKWKNDLFRVPYIYPFVNLEARMKLKPNMQLIFSQKIIELNNQLVGEHKYSINLLSKKSIY